MKKKLTIVSLIAIFLVCIFSLTTNNVVAKELTSEEKVTQEIKNINLPSTAIIDFPLPVVSVYDSTIEWKAQENQEYIEIKDGWAIVTRPTDENKQVTLTVTITNNDVSKSQDFIITVLKGTTVTNTYNIEYVLNGGTNSINNPNSYKVGDEVILENPVKGDVEFLGWYIGEEKVDRIEKGTAGNVTLVAKWAKANMVGINVVTMPNKTVYNALEKFDSTGLVIEEVYDDGSTIKVTSNELISFDKDQLHGDDDHVTISYKGLEAEIEIKVNKLNYDLSNVSFENLTVKYNGSFQTIEKPTNLPEGLTAEVEGGATDVTVSPKLVKLVFTNKNTRDYNTPESLIAYLTVTKAKATVTLGSVSVGVGETLPEAFPYSVEDEYGNKVELSGTFKLTGTVNTGVPGVYEVSGEGLTSDNYEIEYVKGTVIVSAGEYKIHVDEASLKTVYNGKNQIFKVTIKDGDRELTEEELEKIEIHFLDGNKEFTGATDAGKYTVTVTYQYDGGQSGSETFEFVIEQAEYDLSNIKFEDLTTQYNGYYQSISISGDLPSGVSVSYVGGLENVGSTEVVAKFSVTDTHNYKAISDMTATLTITPFEIKSEIFNKVENQIYTGEEIKPAVTGIFADKALDMSNFTVTYSDNKAEGTAKILVTAKENTNFTGSVELTFQIGKTPLVKVQEARLELEKDFGSLTEGLKVATSNGSTVEWLSTSTALTVKDGKVLTIQTTEEQVVVVYALITYEDAAEYARFEFTIPAAPAEEPVETFEKVTDASKLTDGTVIKIASEKDNVIFALGENTGKIFSSVELKDALIITLVKVEGGYFKLKLADGQFIYYSGSSNNAFVGEEKSDGSDQWSIALSDGLFTIINKATPDRYLQYNSNAGQERFACYKGTQHNLVIFADPETLGEEAPHEHVYVDGKCECGAEDPNYEAPVEPTISTITFDVDGGEAVAQATYEEGKGLATLPTTTKEGYEFLGWLLNGELVTSISTEQTGNITLVASWKQNETEEPVETFPYEDKDYNLLISHTGQNKTLYFTGGMSGYYASTSESLVEAVLVNVIKVEGGFNLYVKSTNKYINVVVSGTYNNFKYEDTASTVWTYDETNKALLTKVGEQELFLGTKGTYYTGGLYTIENLTAEDYYPAYLEEAKEVTDADKVALVKESLTLAGTTTVDLTLPTAGEYGAVITWETSNASVISAEGKVTRGTEDVTVTLTATIKVGESEDTKEFEVKVLKEVVIDPEQPVIEKTVSVNIGEYATANSWEDAKQNTDLLMDEVITVKAVPTTGSYNNTGKYYNNGKNWRIYQNENPTITVTSAEGYEIKTIKITYTNSNTGVLTLDETNVASDEIVNVNASSVVFSVGNTGTATNGQVRITNIEVVYSGGSSEEEPVEPTISTITFDVDGGEAVAQATYEEGKGLATLPTTTKEGYEFLGWLLNGELVTSISTEQTGNITLVASWKQNETEEPEQPENPDQPTTTVTETITFDADKTQRTELSNDKQVWSSENVSFINEKASSTTNVGDYTNPVRLYANSKVIIEASAITKIVIVSDGTSKYKSALETALTNAGYTFENTDSTYTITLDEAVNKIEFTLGAQARFKSIEVTCSSSN